MQASASAPTLRSEKMMNEEDRIAEQMPMAATNDDPKTRSACIWQDPKMREMKTFTRSHQHEERLRESAQLETRPTSSAQLKKENLGSSKKGLRSEGCDDMDHAMKKLSKEEATLPYMPRTAGLPASFRPSTAQVQLEKTMDERLALLRRMDRFQTRLTWRDSMDHGLKRLLIDIELSRSNALKEYQRPVQGQQSMWNLEIKREANAWKRIRQKEEMEMTMVPGATPGPPGTAPELTPEDLEIIAWEKKKERDAANKLAVAKSQCDHLDKIYDWYVTHGMKEVRKERKGPPYLKYDANNPVMPGSLRVAPQNTRRNGLGDGKGHSSSSPALLAGGSATMDAGQTVRGASAAGP